MLARHRSLIFSVLTVSLLAPLSAAADSSTFIACPSILSHVENLEEKKYANHLIKQVEDSSAYRFHEFLILDKGEEGIEILSEHKLNQPKTVVALDVSPAAITYVEQFNDFVWFTTIQGRQVYLRRNMTNLYQGTYGRPVDSRWDLTFDPSGFKAYTTNEEGDRVSTGIEPLEGTDNVLKLGNEDTSVVVETDGKHLSKMYLPLIPQLRQMITPDTKIVGTYRGHFRKNGTSTYTVFLELENSKHGRFTLTPVQGGQLVD